MGEWVSERVSFLVCKQNEEMRGWDKDHSGIYGDHGVFLVFHCISRPTFSLILHKLGWAGLQPSGTWDLMVISFI